MKTSRRSTVSRIRVGRRTQVVLDGAQKTSIGEFIDQIGFGCYQLHIFLFCLGALMTEAAAIQMISSLVDAMSDEFHVVTAGGKATYMSCVFSGIQVGTAVAGFLGSLMGRRWPILPVAYVGMIGSAVVCYFAPNVKALNALLVILGAFMGICVPTALISISEVMPSTLRGISGAAIGIAFRLGWLWSSIGLRIFMPDLRSGPWRFLILWSVIPAAVFLLFGLCSQTTWQDSPHFVAIKGKGRDFISSMNLIASKNGRPDKKLIFSEAVTTSTGDTALGAKQVFRIMLTFPIRLYVLVQTILFFSKELVAGGVVAFWPVAWSSLGGVSGLSPATELIITNAISVPGIFIAMWIMHVLPRRRAMVIGTILTAISALLVLLLLDPNGSTWLGIVGVVGVQIFFPTWQMVTMLLPSEVFPSQVRCLALSGTYFIGRFGDTVAQIAVQSSQVGFLIVVAAVAVLCGIVVFLYPETKDTELLNFTTEADDEGRDPASGPRSKGVAGAAKESTNYGSLAEGSTREP